MASSVMTRQGAQDMFGRDTDVEDKGGDPVKGRRYLIFTVLMVIILSVMVITNSGGSKSLQEIAEANIREDQNAGNETDFDTEGEGEDDTSATTPTDTTPTDTTPTEPVTPTEETAPVTPTEPATEPETQPETAPAQDTTAPTNTTVPTNTTA